MDCMINDLAREIRISLSSTRGYYSFQAFNLINFTIASSTIGSKCVSNGTVTLEGSNSVGAGLGTASIVKSTLIDVLKEYHI